MELNIKITGVVLIALALLHLVFPRYFDWKKQLAPLSLINRQIMYIHSFFIAFGVLLMGLLCLSSATDLVNTVLGKRVCLGMGVFWAVRLIIQFFGYSPLVWRGKKLETVVHMLFSALWCYLSWLFLWVGAI